MKKTSIIAISAALMIIVSACDSVLDKNPYQLVSSTGDSSDSIKYKTASLVESAIAGCYSVLRNNEYYNLDLWVNAEMQSDNAYPGDNGGTEYQQIDKYSLTADNTQIARDWSDLYSFIGNANTVIANVPKTTDAALTEARRQQVIAEAKSLRGMFYFELVRLYGSVPLVTYETPTIEASKLEEIYPLLYPARNTEAEIYNQVKKDLKDAIPYLTTSTTNKGIMSQTAAYSLLAKIYATVEPIKWDSVKYYCNLVTSNKSYGLLNNYNDLFKYGAEKNNKEMILTIPCDQANGNWGYSMFIGTDWKKYGPPSNELLALFDSEGDAVRKSSTVLYADVTGLWTDSKYTSDKYPLCYKLRTASNDIILLRLADIILLQAEAENQLGNLGAAKSLVDEVRGRVGLSGTTALTKEDMTLAIEKERRLELAFEGHRWFDLKRTNRLKTVMDAFKYNGKYLYKGLVKADKTNWIWPIPQTQLNLNSNLTQNPGY